MMELDWLTIDLVEGEERAETLNGDGEKRRRRVLTGQAFADGKQIATYNAIHEPGATVGSVHLNLTQLGDIGTSLHWDEENLFGYFDIDYQDGTPLADMSWQIANAVFVKESRLAEVRERIDLPSPFLSRSRRCRKTPTPNRSAWTSS